MYCLFTSHFLLSVGTEELDKLDVLSKGHECAVALMYADFLSFKTTSKKSDNFWSMIPSPLTDEYLLIKVSFFDTISYF